MIFKIQNILPVPVLGRLSRLVEIGGELNLAAKEWRRFDHELGSVVQDSGDRG